MLAREAHDVQGGLARRLVPCDDADVGLRHREAHRVRRRHHRRLGDSLVLDQHALELERRDPVIRGLEDIVGAPDVGDVAIVVAGGDVARVVVTAGIGALRSAESW